MSANRTWKIASSVGWVTFREILRDKILYNALLLAILVFGAALLASRLSFTRPDRIVLDFGVSAVALGTAAVSVLLGGTLLPREIERRTILVALSHPVSRLQFLLGKFAGLALLLAVNWAALSAAFLLIFAFTAPPAIGISGPLLLALLLALLQAWVLGAIAMLFSTLSTAALSATIGAGIYMIGNNISQLRFIASRDPHSAFGVSLKLLSRILPNLEHFNIGFKATYALPVPWTFVAVAFVYAAAWIAVAIVAGGLLLKRREF